VLYLIDIDGFKEVNDRYGHMTGDHLLQVIAQRFRDIQRAWEMVARVGGDEFAFPGTASDVCSLMVQADKAMYAIKKSGKNSFRKFDPSLT
jgi:GGDEF domain-containing protein